MSVFGRDIYYKAIQHFRFSCTKLGTNLRCWIQIWIELLSRIKNSSKKCYWKMGRACNQLQELFLKLGKSARNILSLVLPIETICDSTVCCCWCTSHL